MIKKLKIEIENKKNLKTKYGKIENQNKKI
jgi:hypothetical protein